MFYYLPESSGPASVSVLSENEDAMRNCRLLYNQADDVLKWWDLQPSNTTSSNSSAINPAPSVYVFSARINLGTALNYGLIGIYITFVLALARFVRLYVMGMSKYIMYEDMEDATYILNLCQDIYMARLHRRLDVEEYLYIGLINFLRSPEELMEKTGPYRRVYPTSA